MSEYTQREALSALADDETSELEYRRLLREFDDEDAAAWSRWHLARDLMHGQDSVTVPRDFAAGVRRNLDAGRRRPAWMTGAARMMVAASVAAATVVGWQFWDASTTAGTAGEQPVASNLERAARLNASAGEAALVSGGEEQNAGAERRQPVRPAREQHLNDLMIRHSDLSARHSSQGITANARLVNLESRDEQ